MKGIKKAAQISNDNSKLCQNCEFKKRYISCPPGYREVCYRAYDEGFKKGAQWVEKQIKTKVN